MSYAADALATFEHMLGTLDTLLEKAEACDGGDALLGLRLTDDMFDLELQLRIAVKQVLIALRHVGNAEPPLDEAPYASLAAARTRIARLRADLAAIDARTWRAADEPVTLDLPNGMRFAMSAGEFIRDWTIPNFYFHVTMAYALLRREGLAIGKLDFLGHMQLHAAHPAG